MQQLHLVLLPLRLEIGDGVLQSPAALFKGEPGVSNAAHLLLNFRHHALGERQARQAHKDPMSRGILNAHLLSGIQAAHGQEHHHPQAALIDAAAFLMAQGDGIQLAVFPQGFVQLQHLPAAHGGQGAFRYAQGGQAIPHGSARGQRKFFILPTNQHAFRPPCFCFPVCVRWGSR